MPKKILVIGGAGFIGSHMVLALNRAGYEPIVLDNLSTGHRKAVINAKLIVGDIQDTQLLDAVFNQHQVHGVMHFASFIQVGESVTHPIKYYQNNVAATLQLLSKIIEYKIKYFVFSSSASVYGEPQYTPLDECHPCQPINPYGYSKLMVEQMLLDFAHAYDFHYAALRYFNAAGSDPAGRLHECHDPESHLIPLLVQAAHQHKPFSIYGNDYATSDGTCIRDYIHVNDLCDAHLAALQLIERERTNKIYNLGNGQGWSVLEVINTAEHVFNQTIPINFIDRRAGDPAVLVADAKLAHRELAWRPQYNLSDMINHANLKWTTHQRKIKYA